jgi:hypothetical protein
VTAALATSCDAVQLKKRGSKTRVGEQEEEEDLGEDVDVDKEDVDVDKEDGDAHLEV